MVFGGHGYGAAKKLLECRVGVEQACALCVDVDDVECAGACGKLGFDATQKGFEDRRFEGVKEKD